MSRPIRVMRNAAIGMAVVLVLTVATGIAVVQTQWFRDLVRRKIISATEEGAGGKVEIASFAFDWRHLRAIVNDFVIHGNEPAGAPAFVHVKRVELELQLFTSLKRILELAYLGIDRPEVNILVAADGTTNMPTPKAKSSSNATPLETIVDLAVNRFELTNGLIAFNSQKQPLNVRANDLRVQLLYSLLKQDYRGQISLKPLYVALGRDTPVNFTVTLPIVLQRDRIALQEARIATDQSEILISGSLKDLRNPQTSAHINGHLALAELRDLGNLPIALNASNVPSVLTVDANATFASNAVQVTGLRLGLGGSDLEASGTLKDPRGASGLQFKSRLALGELGRLAKTSVRPDGKLLLNGVAKLDASNNYQVSGTVTAEDLSFQQGAQRILNVYLSSALWLDPHRLDLSGLRVTAFGGQFSGDAMFEDFARFKLNGSLGHLDIRTLAGILGQKDFPYAGTISGPVEVGGDLNASGMKSLTAGTRLLISPGRRGIPMSGRLNAAYRGAADDVSISDSYIVLPHTRLTLSGSLGKRIDVALTTHDLDDILAAVSVRGEAPVSLVGGQANFKGAVVGRSSSPVISGHLAVDRFALEGRRFDAFSADVSASSSTAAVSNGVLTRSAMRAQFAVRAGLTNWKATPNRPLSGDASIQNGDLADIVAMVGQRPAGYSGALSANAHVSGTIKNPVGAATLVVTNGTVRQEPFDRVEAQVKMSDQLLTIPAAYIAAGPARVDLSAELHHAANSLTNGQLHLHVQTNQLALAQFLTVRKQWPGSGGQVQLQADVAGNLTDSTAADPGAGAFLPTNIDAEVSARNLLFEGQHYGDLAATAHTTGKTVSYNVVSDFASSSIRVNGSTQLARGYPTTADASIGKLPIERVLALARRTDIPAKGNLSGTARFSGTLDNPQGNVDLDLANAVFYDEPIDHLRARVIYLPQSIDAQLVEAVAGPSRIELTARLDHPAGNLGSGNLRFHVGSSRIDLTRIRNVQKARPGLGGVFHIEAEGTAALTESQPQVSLHDLNFDLAATGLSANRKSLGDLTLNASTSGGRIHFALNSNLANAIIKGSGSVQPAAGYPTDAHLTFQNVTWTKLHDLLGTTGVEPPAFEAAVDGQVSVSGPAATISDLHGNLELSRLQLNTIANGANPGKPIVIQNQGPITVAVDRGVARVTNLHLAGPQTDFEASGTAAIDTQTLDVTLNANTNIGLLQQFDRDVASSGTVKLVATVRGTAAKPLVNGRLELHNASVNYASLPNGISNANGVVVFNGNSASVRNLTAQSGGGTVTIDGFATSTDTLHFGLRANAANVRVRVDQGVSLTAGTNLNLTGTTQSSILSGTVTITQIAYAPQSDIGSILRRTGPPVQAAPTPSPLLDHMRLDIRVRTSPSMAVQASLAQNLQSDANLQVRGTASQPQVTGRVTINEGKLVFFGSTYNVNSGTISFYNPLRIEPVLNISLETQAQGADVTLTVTGPIDDMKLSYTSDPPLQFQEIVALLASGKTPTSDPNLLANQPSTPPQDFEQMGESALVGKALADPVASRLQRVFGVSQLKVDPTFTSGSDLPQARLTLQQQISTNVTFTYVTDLNDANAQIIRGEWSFNPQWSAVAMRDQNGMVSINVFYKRQIR